MFGQKQHKVSKLIGDMLAPNFCSKISAYSQEKPSSYLYPFGSSMVGYKDEEFLYSFGFGNQKMDNEVSGTGNSYSYTYRDYDPRIGRFKSQDPLHREYPHNSTYAFAENSPIAFIDLEGLERYYSADGSYLGAYGTSTEIRIVHESQVASAKKALNNQEGIHTGYFTDYLMSELMGSVPLSKYAEDVSDVLHDAKLETWAGNNENCFEAAEKQINEAGTKQTGPWGAIQTKVDNSKQTEFTNKDGEIEKRPKLKENKIGGLIYTMTQLKTGNPIMVGVETNYGGDKNNRNALTTHFIVIVSMSVDKDGNISFGVYDNASAAGKLGDNTLDVNSNTGSITGENLPTGYKSYEVTEVRKNNE